MTESEHRPSQWQYLGILFLAFLYFVLWQSGLVWLVVALAFILALPEQKNHEE